MTQTWSTASSSMCWVSSISSSTSRNMSFRLSGPLSRTSRKISGSPRAVAPLASSTDEPKQMDNSSSMIPVRFPSLLILPPSKSLPSCAQHSGVTHRGRTAPLNSWIRFYLESLRSGGFSFLFFFFGWGGVERIGFNGVGKGSRCVS